MVLTVVHPKVNAIADWTQAQLDAQIALGNFAPGTTLAQITLSSDWNANHTVTGSILVDGSTITGDGVTTPLTAVGSSVPFSSVTSGTNTTAAMVVGSGATLTTNGTGTIVATTITSRTIGGVAYDGSANITPTQIQPAAENSDTTNFPLFVNAASGTAQQPKYNSSFGYNSSTNALTATTFVGALTGNSDTATALQTARNIGGVSFNGTADIVPQTIQSNNEATDTTCFPLFVTASGTQSLQPKNNTLLTFNSNTGAFGASALVLAGNASPSYIAGSLYYDTGNESLTFYNNYSNIGLQVGQEDWIRVTNNTGSTIANGSAVYLNGASGGMPTIALAQSNSGSTTIGAGLTTESIANGAIGYVTCIGVVHGLDTSAFTAGATVYISSTVAGGLVSTAPTAPNYRYRIGIVGTVSATVGTIHVTPSTAALGNGLANQILAINSAGTAQEFRYNRREIGFTTPTATVGKITGYAVYPQAGNITAYNIIASAGTVTVKVWKIATGTTAPTSGNSINTSGVSLSTGTAIRSTTLTDFTTTAVAANDMFAFEITASSGVTDLSFTLEIS